MTSSSSKVIPTSLVDFAKKIFNQYEGKILQEDTRISLISNNVIRGEKIECKCSIGILNSEEYPYCVDGEEKTYSIIGGCGYPCKNLEEVKNDADDVLKRYCFVLKEQLSLFDF